MSIPRIPFLALALLPSLPWLGEGDELRLEKALATIEESELRADLYFFASPEMRGRDTPSLEQRVAARFLRARLERLGLAPGAGESYFYEYPMHFRRIDPEQTSLTLAGTGGEHVLRYDRDYWFPSSNDIAALELQGGVVWCGQGERKEFDGEHVQGRWALCLASDMSARRRARYARKAGALGLLLVPDPGQEDDPAEEQCTRVTQYALKGLSSSGKRSVEVFPQVFLSLSAARRLFDSAGIGAGLPELGSELDLSVHERRGGTGEVALENVCAYWPGADPELAQEVIILSAHYDHEGVKGGQIYPGADDNGSGSMGLLALAEALTEYGPMRRSVLLMWVSGEEKGLWGSEAWTRDPLLPEGTRAVCNINIDMIGRNAPDSLLITPTKNLPEYNGLTRLAEELAPLEGFGPLGSADQYWRRSDHMNFAVHLDLPVAFLFADVHDDYHQPTDTPDKIDYDKMRRVTRLILRMLDGLQEDELRL